MSNTRSANIIDRVRRNRWGRISQECRCLMHETWAKDKDFRIYDTKKSKKFKKLVLQFLIQKKYITKYSNYLCTACNAAAEKLLKVDCEEIKEKERDEDYHQQTPTDNELETMVDNLLNKLSSSDPNSLSYEKWAQLISVIAYKVVNKNIYEDGKEISNVYKDFEKLKELDFNSYIEGRDRCVVGFLEGASGISIKGDTTTQIQFAACSIIESIYFLRNFNIILPYSFLMNLEQFLVSGSKTVTAVNGKISVGGSYTSVQKWLNEQGSEPLKSPDGDLVTFFDNIGRYIIQNYRVWTKKSSLADIISTVAHIILNKRVFYKISPNQNLLTGTKVLVQRKFKKE